MFLKESYRQIKYNKYYMRKSTSESAGRYLVLYIILFQVNESKNWRSCTHH